MCFHNYDSRWGARYPSWVIFTPGGQDKPAGISYPPGVKISRVGGKISRDSLPPGGQAVQGGKINCYTGKVVDIKRMTKNPNPGLFIFPFFVFGRARRGVGKGLGAIIFICDPLYQLNTYCFTFSWRYSIELQSWLAQEQSKKFIREM